MEFILTGSFLLILAIVTYYTVGIGFKSYVLLLSSILFISFFSISVAIFSLIFAGLNYFLGILLEKASGNEKRKSKIFWFSIFLDVGILAFFKYFIALFAGVSPFFSSTGIYSYTPYLSVMIPIGISYYTFQSLGYLIRIDRGSEKAEYNFVVFATYLLFFPKFFSGPVARSNQFLPQLNQPAKFDRNNLDTGCRVFLWGLFKKIVIADNLYGPVSDVYTDVHHFSGIPLIIILIVQTVYIYCDFSAYTDMALGLAKIFGINFVDNFNRPFLARNISEFWRRWHISLSSWCNDFIYNPFIIKFRRFGNHAVIAGIFLTFFIVGIWHGANWTFVILGLMQGVAIVYEFHTKRYRLKFAARFSKSSVNAFSRILVFIFMSLTMVFFFSKSVEDAWYFISHLFEGIQFQSSEIDFINNRPVFFIALIFFAALFVIEILNEKGKNLLLIFLKQTVWIRWLGYLSIICLIYLFYSGFNVFYYVRF